VARIVLRDVFFASIFLACVEPKLFFAFTRENSPVQPRPTYPTTLRGSSPAFLAEKKKSQNKNLTTTSEPFNYINAEIDRRDDGDVRIAERISDILRAKNQVGPPNTLTKGCANIAR
jgi:hypothetical protein